MRSANQAVDLDKVALIGRAPAAFGMAIAEFFGSFVDEKGRCVLGENYLLCLGHLHTGTHAHFL
jgi:hypothetical protein